ATAETINTPTTPKKRSLICSVCPTACATASTIAPPMKELKSGFANAWKRSNGSSSPLPAAHYIQQKENLKPDSCNLINSQQLQAGGFRGHQPAHGFRLLRSAFARAVRTPDHRTGAPAKIRAAHHLHSRHRRPRSTDRGRGCRVARLRRNQPLSA